MIGRTIVQWMMTAQVGLLLHSCFLMIMRDLWKVRIKGAKKLGSLFPSFLMNMAYYIQNLSKRN